MIAVPHSLRRRRPAVGAVLAALLALLLAAILLAAGVGAYPVAPARLLSILSEAVGLGHWVEVAAEEQAVVTMIRAPRVLLGVLVGANLALGGAVMQGLFRNPLADPGLIGISGGAAVAAVSAIVLGTPAVLGAYGVPVAAFVGSVAATAIVFAIGTRAGRTMVMAMLLTGIAVNAFAGAITGLFSFISDDLQIREFLFWTMGSLGGGSWESLLLLAPFLLLSLAGSTALARGLNAVLLGEAEARHLGIDTQRLKQAAIVLTALGVGLSTALAGMIGFVGIVVPHMLRLLLGPDHRLLLPATVLSGGTFLVLADLLARTVVQPAELPIGVLTAAVGAPFFIWLIVRRRDLFGG